MSQEQGLPPAAFTLFRRQDSCDTPYPHQDDDGVPQILVRKRKALAIDSDSEDSSNEDTVDNTEPNDYLLTTPINDNIAEWTWDNMVLLARAAEAASNATINALATTAENKDDNDDWPSIGTPPNCDTPLDNNTGPDSDDKYLEDNESNATGNTSSTSSLTPLHSFVDNATPAQENPWDVPLQNIMAPWSYRAQKLNELLPLTERVAVDRLETRKETFSWPVP